MGRVLAIGAVAIAILIVVGLFLGWFTREKKPFKGDLSRREELKQQELLESAASIMFSLSTPTNVSEFNILTDDTRDAVDEWRQRYSKYAKEITGA